MSNRAIFSAKILGAIFLLVVLALLQVTSYFDLPYLQQGQSILRTGTAAPEAAPQFVGEIDMEGLKIEARLAPGERRLELSFTNTSAELNFWVKTTALYWTVIVDDLKNQYAVDSVSLSPENSVNLKIEPGQSQVIGTVLNKPVSSEATELKIFLQDVSGVYHGKKAGGSPKDFSLTARITP